MRGPRRRDPEGLGDDHPPRSLHAVDVPGDSMSGGGALVVSHSSAGIVWAVVWCVGEAARRRAGEPYACSGRRSRRQRAAPPVRCGIGRGLSKLLGPRRVGGESLATGKFMELFGTVGFLLVSYRPLAHALDRRP